MSTMQVSKEIVGSTTGPKLYRLKVWVTETSNNIPGEVFVYQNIPAVPDYNGGLPEDRFVHIASYADLVAFPKDGPGLENPYFRKYYIDITHKDRTFLEDKWKLMSQQLQVLISDITRINALPPGVLEEVPTVGVCIK